MERKIRFQIFLLVLGVIAVMFLPRAFCLADESTPTVVVPPEEVGAPPPGGGMPAAWFMPPKAPEGGFRILINNDVKYTDSPIVNLNLFGGPDTARMAISNFSDFRDAGQESYTTSKTWNLCKGRTSCPEGEYTVYAKFYAPWGTASEVVSDSIIYKKPIAESIIAKINEIARKIADLRKQIAQLFKKEIVAEVPEAPPEEIVPSERPPEEIVPPAKELPKEEIISPPKEILPEKEKVRPFDLLKEYVRWLWQNIINFWQKIWPF